MSDQAAPLALALPEELLAAITDEVASRVAWQLAPPVPDPWMNVDQAAEYMACKPKRIYDLCSQRRLDHRKDGSRTLIRRSVIDAYLDEPA